MMLMIGYTYTKEGSNDGDRNECGNEARLKRDKSKEGKEGKRVQRRCF